MRYLIERRIACIEFFGEDKFLGDVIVGSWHLVGNHHNQDRKIGSPGVKAESNGSVFSLFQSKELSRARNRLRNENPRPSEGRFF
jgi:hypothetical protein